MGTYAFSAMLSAISYYLGALYLACHTTHIALRKRGASLFVLIGGFFLFTCLRTVTSDPQVARISILALYAHAVLIPPLFLDFVTLYVSMPRLRTTLMPVGYLISLVFLFCLATGSLITGISQHPYLSFYGMPGPMYGGYLVFIASFTIVSLVSLLSSVIRTQEIRTRASFIFIASALLCVAAMFNTLLPTFGFSHVPKVTYLGYLAPCLTMYAFYRHGFLGSKPKRTSTVGSRITVIVTVVSTVILSIVLLNGLVFKSYYVLPTAMASVLALMVGTLALASNRHFNSFVIHSLGLDESLPLQSPGELTPSDKGSDLSNLLDIINHDFRGVLSSLSIGIQGLKHDERVQTQQQTHQRLRDVEADARCLKDMINGLESIFSTDDISVDCSWHRIDDVVNYAHSQLMRRFPHPRISVRVAEIPEIFGPPEVTYHLLTNLLENCVKYSSHKSEIVVDVESTIRDGLLVIKIRDNGIGIQKRELKRVLKPFVRGSNWRLKGSEIPGRGIGLAIVSRLIQKMGWRFELESEYGCGTTASIILPATHFRA